MDKNPAPFPASLQQPAKIVDGEKWLLSQKAANNTKPFFLYMSIPEPHNPYQVSEPYYSMFPPELTATSNRGASAAFQRKQMGAAKGDDGNGLPRL